MEGLLKLDKSFLIPAAEMFAEAFFNDPMFAYMNPDQAQRRKVLPAIFKGMLGFYLSSGKVFATSENLEGIICVTGLHEKAKSRNPISSFFDALRMPFSVARHVSVIPMLKRAAKMRRGVSQYRECKSEYKDCVHIDLVAVAAQHRGKKLMSALMRPVLSEAAMQGKCCILDTEEESNIAIYQHFGFKLVKAIEGVPGELNFNVMVCEPDGGLLREGMRERI